MRLSELRRVAFLYISVDESIQAVTARSEIFHHLDVRATSTRIRVEVGRAVFELNRD